MPRYLLSVWYPPDATQPLPDELAHIHEDVTAVHGELEAAGAWVFGGGLHEASTSTVVTVRGGDVLVTDGPYVETKEQLGGFSVIDVPDLDAALSWAERTARATTCAIEVRPFVDEPGA
jgi:hypothetical protein